jgi:hypothetical protein
MTLNCAITEKHNDFRLIIKGKEFSNTFPSDLHILMFFIELSFDN